ncbi:MAG: chorismate mutase [Firmicutes bacterium]|nr:chorismate mutase [Bacillota bacterium]
MNDLEQARQTISDTDRQIAELFCRRMEAVRAVAAYKKERGLQILDEKQEKLVLERNSSYINDPEIRAYYRSFMQETMDLSRKYQHRLIEGARIAYSGVEGAFAHIAAGHIFPDGDLIAYPSFEQAYAAAASGECDSAVLPIENSYAGEVGQVIDLMFSGSLLVNGVYDLRIVQNLLGLPGAKLADVTTVISHPQALSQCEEYIRRRGLAKTEAPNTAWAAQRVAALNDIHTAAIASHETARLYGLQVLDHDVNESKNNTTRFAVFSRVSNDGLQGRDGSTFLLFFSVRNEAGALAKAINVIGAYGFNMNILRSRPLKTLPWKYYFYVEAEGDAASVRGRQMLEALSAVCEMLKVGGCYTAISGTLQDGDDV